MNDVIIIDNSPQSYMFQHENGMPILSWYEDRSDTKLLELIQPLKLMSEVPDVRPILLNCTSSDNVFSNTEAIIMCERIITDMR